MNLLSRWHLVLLDLPWYTVEAFDVLFWTAHAHALAAVRGGVSLWLELHCLAPSTTATSSPEVLPLLLNP